MNDGNEQTELLQTIAERLDDSRLTELQEAIIGRLDLICAAVADRDSGRRPIEKQLWEMQQHVTRLNVPLRDIIHGLYYIAVLLSAMAGVAIVALWHFW